MNGVNLKEMAVLVVSCDKYWDVWRPFFYLFFKFWPDCPYKVYLGTNVQKYADSRITAINVGPDISWSSNYRLMLERIDEPYVLTFLDDYLLCKKIDSTEISKILQIIKKENICFCRLNPKPSGTKPYKNYTEFKEIKAEDRFCINTQIAIWDKCTLMELLSSNYNPWEFEVLNSIYFNERGELPGTFVACNEPIFRVKNGIDKGKWLRSSLIFCIKQGVKFDDVIRPKQNLSNEIWIYRCGGAAVPVSGEPPFRNYRATIPV